MKQNHNMYEKKWYKKNLFLCKKMLMDLVSVNFFLSRLFPIEHILFFHHRRRYLE